MTRKGLLVLIIGALVATGAFAQSDFASMAKNTITVDVGPTILGLALGIVPSLMGAEDMDISGFGIAGQYERQLSRPLSVTGRFSYLSAGVGMTQSDEGYTGKMSISLVSFSAEGHVRFYPSGNTFFLNGMVGYANFKIDFSDKVYDYAGRENTDYSFAIAADRSYIKFGAGLGWRISFGRNGGFTFEPSVGYSFLLGMGAPIGDRIAEKLKDKLGVGEDVSSFTEIFPLLEQFGVGGIRYSLAFGYRF